MNLFKIYDPISNKGIPVIKNLSLNLTDNELVALNGSSGSGKSTLLNMIAGKIHPDAGDIIINDQNVLELSPYKRYNFYRSTVSFVHQHDYKNLFLNKSIEENILMALIFHKYDKSKINNRIEELLEYVDLLVRKKQKIKFLSGGERQKVALCCAIAINQSFLIMDEPTGNLDSIQGKSLINLVKRLLNEDLLSLVLIATHNSEIANLCDEICVIQDGRIAGSRKLEKSTFGNDIDSISESYVNGKSSQTTVNEQKFYENQWDIILDKEGTLTIPKQYLKNFDLPLKFSIVRVSADTIELKRKKGN